MKFLSDNKLFVAASTGLFLFTAGLVLKFDVGTALIVDGFVLFALPVVTVLRLKVRQDA